MDWWLANADQTMLERAVAMFGTRRTLVLGEHRYAIEAAKLPNVWHVDLNLNPPYCDCPAFMYCRTPQTCKHVLFFLLFEGALSDADSRFVR